MDISSMLFYEGLRVFLGPLYSMHLRMRAEGADNVPQEGGAIIVSNHRSYADPLVIGYCVDRFVNFAAGSHLYLVPGSEHLFRLVGFFKMNIYGGDAGDASLSEGAQLLRNGELIGIFPEGIESFMHVYSASKIATFKTGFAKLALENKVPIIPVAIAASEEKQMLPKLPGKLVSGFVKHPDAKNGIELITYRHVTCRIGKPLDLSPFYGEEETKNVIDEIAGKVRRVITKLYDGEDLDRFMTGDEPFNFARDRV
ncbi:MAG: lysophospholipid acyltransferase family protein [Candidatus Geothermincolia bacterium]